MGDVEIEDLNPNKQDPGSKPARLHGRQATREEIRKFLDSKRLPAAAG